MKTIIFAFIMAFAINARATTLQPPQNGKPDDKTVATNVTRQVQRVVGKEKLIINPACVEYVQSKDGEPGLTRVDVMEKHGGKCPGDIHIRHRLFSVYVDDKTHQMLSDKDDPEEGTFSLLPDAP